MLKNFLVVQFADQFRFPGKLPTYPSLNTNTLTPTAHLAQNSGLGEG